MSTAFKRAQQIKKTAEASLFDEEAKPEATVTTNGDVVDSSSSDSDREDLNDSSSGEEEQ